MQMVLDILSAVLLIFGSFFCVVGGIGMHRMPDFYTRSHAAGITDTMGAGMILCGLICQAGFTLNGGRLLLILVFLYISSATSGHILTKAAYLRGLKPWVRDPEDLP